MVVDMIRKIEYYLSKFIKKMHLRSIKNSNINKTSKICAGTLFVDSSMGKYSDIGYDCSIINTTIGNFCSFGSNIKIGGASHPISWGSSSTVFCEYSDHIKKKFARHSFEPSTKTIIGSDVWIADNVMIKAGVKVGNGAVIGMGAVVTKDVPSYEIWAGNPAKCIGLRFEKEIAEKLERTCWWDLEDSEIEAASKFINDIDSFINYFENKGKSI